jgi:hypothetical protein
MEQTKLTLTEQDLKELNDFFQELPTKYGMPMINFFNKRLEDIKPKEEIVAESTKEE